MMENNKEVHMFFIRFKKVYDCIHREYLVCILEQFDLPQKLVNLLKANIMYTEIKEYVGNSSSTTGLRQRDTLSLLLFNIALE